LVSDQREGTIGRRQLLRTGMFGFLATATGALEGCTDASTPETKDDKHSARFQVSAAEVQSFYRVNRYPKG
jgi:hypothetical protein